MMRVDIAYALSQSSEKKRNDHMNTKQKSSANDIEFKDVFEKEMEKWRKPND